MTTNLKINISTYVKTFNCVTMPQIRYMFRYSNQDEVNFYLKALLFEHDLIRKGDNIGNHHLGKGDSFDSSILEDQTICARRGFFPSTAHIQRLISDSAWVAAAFGPDKIVCMKTTQYPTQLFLCTFDGKPYDVTVIYPGTQKATMQAAKKVFDISVLPNTNEDLIEHIALVYNEQDAKLVRESGIFDYLCLLKKDATEVALEKI